MKKRMLAISAAIFVAAAALTFQAMASFEDQAAVINHVTTGDVKIAIQEFEIRDGKEQIFTNQQTVFPGDTISKIPRILNLGEPCWIRASVVFDGDLVLSDQELGGIPEGWKRCGNYYYYQKPLKHRENVVLFESVQVPTSVTEALQDKSFQVAVRAEAVQSLGFTPDFNSEEPWGDQTIEDCVHEESNQHIPDIAPVTFHVEFEGGAHRLVAAPDDFFQNFRYLMPASKVSDSVTISNTTENPAELFFSTGYEKQTESQTELLEALELEITYRDRVIYQGNLKADSLNTGVSLGTFSPKETAELNFTVHMPETLTNEYANRNADVRWIFAVREEEPGAQPVDNSTQSRNPVKTGDESPIAFFGVMAVVAFAVALALWVQKRRKDHET